MAVRVTKRHNADGSITTRTTVSRKTLFGGTKSETWVTKDDDTRQSHSLIFHILLCAIGIGIITIPYITFSSRHKWRLI